MFQADPKTEFDTRGFAIAEGLFSPEEVKSLIDHFMAMHDRGGDGWAEGSVDMNDPDPLRRYPRLLQPHRGDAVSMDYMTDPRINQWLTKLLGREPYAVQTMVYFKPAGARGQALHQDQRYLCVEPGTCVAAWLALDDCDEENGCLTVVPRTQNFPMLCPIPSDITESFTGETVPVPDGYAPEAVRMKSGDVLFFNGSLIHGSLPNRSQDRFRRIIVGHYIVGEAHSVAKYYHPVYRMDGSQVELNVTVDGGKCGTFVEEGGEQVFRLEGTIEGALRAH